MRKAEAFFLCFFLLFSITGFRKNGADLYAQESEDTGVSDDPGLNEPDTDDPAYTDPGYDEPDSDPAYDDPDSDEGGYYEEEVPIEGDYTGYVPELYSRGDQTFTITLGVVFPAGFTGDDGRSITHNLSPVGGTGSLSYTYFFDAHWFVGGEIGGMFIGSVAENMYFIVPIGIRGGYQFVLKRFEIPLTAALGMAPQRYLDLGYFGFYTKLGGSLFFRFSPDWSFGLNSAWWWAPQWTSDASKNVNGNFMEVTLSARYHF
jgi:hypothetical protein